jgi:hypothetical protein
MFSHIYFSDMYEIQYDGSADTAVGHLWHPLKYAHGINYFSYGRK